MTNLWTILNVAIGLALTYLVLSLVATAIQEGIAAVFRLRAATLKSGLASLLADPGSKKPQLDPFFVSVFGHGLVQRISSKGAPSYVPARNITLALLDVLKDGSQANEFTAIERAVAELPPSPIRQSLSVLMNEASGDIDVLKTRVDKWIDDSMDRISGTYKRNVQITMLAVGFVIACGFNVDSLHVAKSLWAPEANSKIVQTATNFLARHPAAGKKNDPGQGPVSGSQTDQDPAADLIAAKAAFADALDEVSSLPIPIGWKDFLLGDPKESKESKDSKDSNVPKDPNAPKGFFFILARLFEALPGWIMTALAISLGAPFWFDLLQGLINLRATGPKPPRADSPETPGDNKQRSTS
ncbi:hypothetical protein [Mesorhizobium carmichaelinearum]|uniref:hypothetical protein n=1 Tax=Mesorhizobium carmichaelinearum TaxID=1208188 RepID=UPI000BA427A4|nr:hypothetical protein [Mesorhizobium carmichaelinearum]